MENKNKFDFGKLLGRNVNYFIVGAILLVSAVLYYSGILNAKSFITPNMLTQIGYTIILVVSLNMVVGFLGELSLGHAGFMYIGAYVGGIASFFFAKSEIIANPIIRIIVCMLIGGVIAAVFGLIIGLPALRLRGDYLAIVTLAFGEIVRGVLKNIKINPDEGIFKGFIKNASNGFTLERYGPGLFVIVFIVVLITIFCVQSLMRSKHGRAIQAIKDNEIAARAMGINITYYKLMVFAISAFFAGVAGVLSASYQSVSYQIFSYNYSIEILVMVVLGGMGSITGSVISAVLITFINSKLQAVLTGNLASLKYLVYALILIFMMILHSSPKLAGVREKLNWKNFPGFIKKLFGKRKKEQKEGGAEV